MTSGLSPTESALYRLPSVKMEECPLILIGILHGPRESLDEAAQESLSISSRLRIDGCTCVG